MTHLECSLCSRNFKPGEPHTLCECGGPLLVRYDLARVRNTWPRDSLASSRNSMWRYAPLLPVRSESSIISLGEGMTPLLAARRTGERIGAPGLLVKDEGLNPTGSFKARGLSCAVSMCIELGITKLAVPSAGNAAHALAAYAAAAGLEARLFMPKDVPQSNFVACKASGAHVTLVDGLLNDCVRTVSELAPRNGWFDISTFKEPYRLEGKKTLGYEAAEQLGWELPDAILYPTGGGIGLIGIWKAFEEMEALGWIGPRRPKMIAVQAEGCQPIVRAFESGAERCEFWQHATTIAAGLRAPKPFADFLILRILHESRGTAIAVSDEALIDAGLRIASEEGVFPSPEGAACFAAAESLISSGFLDAGERILIYNTGSGLKYPEVYATRFPRAALSETDKLGGLITPR